MNIYVELGAGLFLVGVAALLVIAYSRSRKKLPPPTSDDTKILFVLSATKAMTAAEVADATGLPWTSMRGMLSVLEGDGRVVSGWTEGDLPVRCYWLATKAGTDVGGC